MISDDEGMKVLYLTVPSFFDLEISLIRELSRFCDVTVMMIVSPEGKNSSAFSINKLLPKSQIVLGRDFLEIQKYGHLIDLNKWYIANNPDNSINSCWKLAMQIKNFIKDGKYDLLHSTTNCKTSFFLIPFVWKFKNTLYTTHDPIPHVKRNLLARLIKSDTYYHAFKNLLFLSHALEDKFLSLYHFDGLKIYHSSLGVYDFLTSYEKTANPYGKYILFFGRISEYKGVDLLTSAFVKSICKTKGYKLVIAGKGSISYCCQCEDVILLNRYIENEELANLIRNCDFVVLPYRSATQSGCVMSAYAFNKPILATNVGDLPHSVINGEMGLVVEANNEMALQKGLDKMISENLEGFSNNIKKKFMNGGPASWKQIAASLYESYKQICE